MHKLCKMSLNYFLINQRYFETNAIPVIVNESKYREKWPIRRYYCHFYSVFGYSLDHFSEIRFYPI